METDRELLNSARGRNKDALIQIFDHYASALYYYAMRLIRDPVIADHIVGDVFTKFLEQIWSGKGPKTNLRSYLYQMTYHLIIDQVRSSRRSAPLEVANSLVDDVHSSSSSLENQMLLEVVLKVIQNELTDDQRHVIVLRFFEEYSLKETAEILGKQVDNIKMLQNRAIAKLRKNLGLSGTETALA